MSADINIDPYRSASMQEIIDAWLPLTFAVNNLNRAMGNADLYPFVLSPAVVIKLGFVHDVVVQQASDAASRDERQRLAS